MLGERHEPLQGASVRGSVWPIKGKHLYHTGSGNNYMLNPQCEEKKQVIRTPFLYKEPEPSDLKLQETLLFVVKISYYFC